MERLTGRLERDVEEVRRDVREVREVALKAAVDIAAHKDGCVEAAERTQEKIEDVRASVAQVNSNVIRLETAIRERRAEDAEARRERQESVDHAAAERVAHVDLRLSRIEGWNRRVGIAVVIAAISLIGYVLGSTIGPLLRPAADAVKMLR